MEQVADPTDGRAKLVRYTDAGAQGYRLGMRLLGELEHEYRRVLGEDEMDALARALETMATTRVELPSGVPRPTPPARARGRGRA